MQEYYILPIDKFYKISYLTYLVGFMRMNIFKHYKTFVTKFIYLSILTIERILLQEISICFFFYTGCELKKECQPWYCIECTSSTPVIAVKQHQVWIGFGWLTI